jgi:acyl-coenzyme A synthetase/AMP-(fatty) acid ligase
MNLSDPILRHGRMRPNAPALIDGERVIGYGALEDLVLRTAGHLAALGVEPGDQVGLCLKDDWQQVVGLLAVLRLGATAVQMDWRSRPAEKARIATAFALKLTLTLPESDIAAPSRCVALDAAWQNAVATADAFTGAAQHRDAPAAVLASSGTTGLPKFTLATHMQLYLHAIAYLEIVPATRQRFLLTLPHYFSAGRLVCLAHLMRGDTLILHPSLFTAAEYVRAVNRHKATAGFIVPSVVRQLFAIAEPDKPLFPDLEVLICGGAPLFPDEKREALRKLTPRFHEMYGAAAIGPMSALRPQDLIERPTSVGQPFLLVEVEAVDDDERPLGPDIPGRLRCRGLGLTTPIAGIGEAPSAGDFRDGWHYPGEIAAIDEHGYVHLHGRSSEVIFRGGAKIFPAEVEAALQAHEAVAEAAVVGREESDKQQTLIAYVVTRRAVAAGELIAHCRTRLTAFKVPQQIRIVSELPRNSSGKLDKRALLAEPGPTAHVARTARDR